MTAARIIAMSGALLLAATPLAAEPLITGSATYEIEFDADKSTGSAAAGIFGEMILSLKHDCTAYRTDAAIDITFAPASGKPLKMAMRSTLVEDGDTLDFQIASEMGNAIAERAEGTARRSDDGISVALTAPSKKTFTVAGPVLFPIAMIEAALAAAKAGKTFVDLQVFDGSAEGEEVWSLSVIVTPVAASEDLGEEALFATGLGFEALDRWRMKFSYFKSRAGGDQMPAFSTEAIVYANGFTLASVYDLGGAAVRLKLIDFSPIPPTPCG